MADQTTFSEETDRRILQLLADAPDAGSFGLLRVEGIDAGPDAAAAEEAQRYQEAANTFLEAYKEKRASLNTHQLLTTTAMELIGMDARALRYRGLIEESAGPDRSPSSVLLFMEGHFYGETGPNQFGNYFPLCFSSRKIAAFRRFNNVDEHAKSNFLTQFAKVDAHPDNLSSHGWALHYLQDMTAPHHAGNLPALFKRHGATKASNHMEFEKFANLEFNRQPLTFRKLAAAPRTDLNAANFNLSTPEGRGAFADWTFGKAKVHATKAQSASESDQRDAVTAAIPLAIAVTAHYLEYHRLKGNLA